MPEVINKLSTTLLFVKLQSKIEAIDTGLSNLIDKFLEGYYPRGNLPYFSALLPNFIKLLIYSLPPLAFFAFFKLLYPYSRVLTWIMIINLAIVALAIAGLFAGLFQLAYTF